MKGKITAPLMVGVLLIFSLLLIVSSIGYYSFVLLSVKEIDGTATVNGTFYNSTDNRVWGVEVAVKGTSLRTYTDVDGQYCLDGVPAGEQTFVFQRGGYPTLEVKQLVLPVDNLPVNNLILDIPDNLEGGVLVDKPSYKYVNIGEGPGNASLKGILFSNDTLLTGISVQVFNSTGKTTETITDMNGTFFLEGLRPGLFMFNVSAEDFKAHGLVFLARGSNEVTFHESNTTFLPSASVEPEELSIEVPGMETGVQGYIFAIPQIYNNVNRTLANGIPGFGDTFSSQRVSSGNVLWLMPHHIYSLEVAIPGHQSVIYPNYIPNGNGSIELILPDEIPVQHHSYSLKAYYGVIIFLVLMAIMVSFGLKSAFGGKGFGLTLCACMAAFFSSVSLPLSSLETGFAHNWLVGGVAFIILVSNRKKYLANKNADSRRDG